MPKILKWGVAALWNNKLVKQKKQYEGVTLEIFNSEITMSRIIIINNNP